MVNVRIYSYNLLSSSLASPTYFTHCTKANLLASNRLLKVQSKLSAECLKHSVICLQELSRKWEGPMTVFFEAQGYQLVTGMYGHSFNGFMGVGVAYPMDTFEGVKIDIERLADTCKWPVDPAEHGPGSGSYKRRRGKSIFKLFGKLFDAVAKVVVSPVIKLGLLPPAEPRKWTEDPWVAAEKRSNIMVSARLRPKSAPSNEFLVSCYHMPCAFKTPQIMMLHSALAARRCRELATGTGGVDPEEPTGPNSGCPVIPHALVGDFNFMPNSPMYNMVTTGEVNESTCVAEWEGKWQEHVPRSKFGMDWEVGDLGGGMDSAYFAADGKEPDFTNYARIRDDDPFIGTLDYVFLSKKTKYGTGEWKVSKTDKIVNRDEIDGPLPNDSEPSDHVAIGVDINIV